MLRPESERSQDQEVKCALRKINPLRRHVLPFHFYKERTPLLVEAQGETRPDQYPEGMFLEMRLSN